MDKDNFYGKAYFGFNENMRCGGTIFESIRLPEFDEVYGVGYTIVPKITQSYIRKLFYNEYCSVSWRAMFDKRRRNPSDGWITQGITNIMQDMAKNQSTVNWV